MSKFIVEHDDEGRPAYLYFNQDLYEPNRRLYAIYFKKQGGHIYNLTGEGLTAHFEVFGNDSKENRFGVNVYGRTPDQYPKIVRAFQHHVDAVISELKHFDMLGQIWNEFEDKPEAKP